jgi:hypothetical protein
MFLRRRCVGQVVEFGVVDMIWYNYPLLTCLTKLEWSYLYTYSCVFVFMVGIVTAFLDAGIHVDGRDKGNF